MSSTTTPQKTARTRAHEELAAVRGFVRGNHGSLNQITEEAKRLGGKESKISRHTVGRWLSEDIKNFQEPKLGNALLLTEALKNLQAKGQT